jgi:hypothetical protein
MLVYGNALMRVERTNEEDPVICVWRSVARYLFACVLRGKAASSFLVFSDQSVFQPIFSLCPYILDQDTPLL